MLLAAAVATAGGAGKPSAADHDRAHAARQRGEALPLARILAIVEREVHGRVIEIELERDGGKLLYELELLLPDGRVIEVDIDARSGEFVKLEGARLETVFKPRAQDGALPR
jgi:uncharacterized membrane protein YkoI